MIVEMLTGGLVTAVVGGLVGYGELRGKVNAHAESVSTSLELLRDDIKRLEARIEHLTEFLLREFHGESSHQARGPA